MPLSTSPLTLVDVLTSRQAASGHTSGQTQTRLIRAASVVFMTTLTAAAAQVSVPLPFTQVPFTFQPMVVLLAGLVLGSRLGLSSQLLYLAAGIAGLPVFAASLTLPPGIGRLVGPTGGYLMAYPLAAYLTGYLAERGVDRRYIGSVFAMCAGLLLIYLFGATWLGLFAPTPTGTSAIGLRAALLTGVVPFIAADVVKLLIAAGIVPSLWKLLGR